MTRKGEGVCKHICLLLSFLLPGTSLGATIGEKIVQLPAKIQSIDKKTNILYSDIALVQLPKNDLHVIGAFTFDINKSKLGYFSYPSVKINSNDLKDFIKTRLALRFSPDGRFAFARGWNSDYIFLWKNGNMQPVHELPPIYDIPNFSLNFNNNYITAGEFYELRILDISRNKFSEIQLYDPIGQNDYTFNAVLNKSNTKIALLTEFGTGGFFKLNPANPPRTLEELKHSAYGQPVHYMAYVQDSYSVSDDGKLLAVGSSIFSQPIYITPEKLNDLNMRVGQVYDFEKGTLKYNLKGQKALIAQTVFSRNGKYLATRGGASESCIGSPVKEGTPYNERKPVDPYGDGNIALRDARNGKIIKLYKHACTGPFFTGDSKKLLFSDAKNRLHIVDVP